MFSDEKPKVGQVNRIKPSAKKALIIETVAWLLLILAVFASVAMVVLYMADALNLPNIYSAFPAIILIFGPLSAIAVYMEYPDNWIIQNDKWILPVAGLFFGPILSLVAFGFADAFIIDFGGDDEVVGGAISSGLASGAFTVPTSICLILLVEKWISRHQFNSSAVQSQGTVVEKIDEHESDGYGGTLHTYYVFVALKDDRTRTNIRAEVGKAIFDYRVRGESIGVRYVLGKPRAALLEGEY